MFIKSIFKCISKGEIYIVKKYVINKYVLRRKLGYISLNVKKRRR